MQNFRQKAVQVFTSRLGLNTRAIPQIAVPFQRRNSLWQQVPGAETQKSVAANAVANGASTTVWTPAAGNALYIIHLSFSSSIAGIVRLDYNAITIFSALVPAGALQSLPIGGLCLFPFSPPPPLLCFHLNPAA